MKHRESALETGLLLLALGLVAGAGVFVLGKTLGAGQQSRRHAEAAPEAGSIAPERHQHISTVAAR